MIELTSSTCYELPMFPGLLRQRDQQPGDSLGAKLVLFSRFVELGGLSGDVFSPQSSRVQSERHDAVVPSRSPEPGEREGSEAVFDVAEVRKADV